MLFFDNSERFRLWRYQVGHQGLVIRRPKSSVPGTTETKNLDIKFYGVFYLEVIDTFDGLRIESLSDEELDYVKQKCKHPYDNLEDVFYALRSGGNSFYIGATQILIEENTLEGVITDL